MSESYRLNAPEVVSETIEGEAVVVNLAEGTYYSLQNTATDIWELLLTGLPVGDVVDHLERRFDAPRAQLEEEVARFVGELRAEKLVVGGTAPATSPPLPAANGKQVFSPPRLERFTDMQELLALDPIHEVDEAAGWPQKV